MDNSSPNQPTRWEWGKDERNCIGAAHSTTDPTQLMQMVDDITSGKIVEDGLISEALIENPHLPFNDAFRLASVWQGVNDYGYALCSRGDATADALDAWCNHWDSTVVEMVARHPNTSTETLEKLLRGGQPKICELAILSSRLPQDRIDPFATHKAANVRTAVAKVSGDREALARLANDSEPKVRVVAAKNPNLELRVINQMAEQEQDLDVLATIAERLEDAKLLRVLAEKLAGHHHGALAKAILQNPNARGGPHC